jgi:hypothetical protein
MKVVMLESMRVMLTCETSPREKIYSMYIQTAVEYLS